MEYKYNNPRRVSTLTKLKYYKIEFCKFISGKLKWSNVRSFLFIDCHNHISQFDAKLTLFTINYI
jgi:prephenate dehydratase